VSSTRATFRLPLRLLSGVLGVLLLTYLIRRAGPAKLLESITTLGWGLSLVIALGGVSHVVKTWAWRLTLLDEKRHVSFPRMLALRLGSEAVGQFGFLGQAFGETLRVSLLSPTMPLATGLASVTLDRAFFILSAATVTAAGLLAVIVVLPLPHALSLYAGLFVVPLLGVILVSALAVHNRWAVFSGPAHFLGRSRYLNGWVERKRPLLQSVESKLLDFYHRTPRAFWAAFGLNLACQAAAVLEVYVILWLLGARLSFFAALGIEALTKLINVVGILNPGNIGTYEGGNMLIAEMFGLSGATGLTLAFARRVRAIFWSAVGGLWLVLLSKSKQSYSSDSTQAPIQKSNQLTTDGRSHVAVILANNLHVNSSFGARLPEVGALPVLLRAILGAEKAGAERIVVVLNPATASWVKRGLLSTRRTPRSLEWFEIGDKGTSLPSLLGQLTGEFGSPLVLIAGDRTYHPSLHRQVAEWKGEGDALALTTGSQLAGIYALSKDMAMDVAKNGPSDMLLAGRAPSPAPGPLAGLPPPSIRSLEELHAWLISTHSVECEPVPQDKWQRVLTQQDRLLAEQKLDRWLVKPTDGVFARMNRRVSIPISRWLIKFPITPNMVSLFTLGVSFVSGVYFAFGGYWNMLLGAILSVFASILDGSDGEVARLKFQESAFGCWLETVCDYLYYLFIFAGMTIGLMRTSGTKVYLAWGGLLLFGAVTSFFVTGLQRHSLTNGRPEQLLGIWQTQAASRRSNPFLFFGRHVEFVIRRCFLPYVFLFFALFNIMPVLFILAVLGANVVWPIALYSHRTFTRPASA